MIACIAGAILCSQSAAMHIAGPIGYAAQPVAVAYYVGPPVLQPGPAWFVQVRRA